MDTLRVILKLIILLVLAVLPFVPLLLEYLVYRRDVKQKVSHRRLRIVLSALVYVIIVTLVLQTVHEAAAQVGQLGFVQWLANRVSVDGRLDYCCELMAVVVLNAAIGLVFWLLQCILRLGRKDDLSVPHGYNKQFTFPQRFERKVLSFFEQEVFYLLGKVLHVVLLLLSAAYCLFLLVVEIPALFQADWFPYDSFVSLFPAMDHYFILSLLLLGECAFFLDGVHRLKEECPDFHGALKKVPPASGLDLKKIDEACKQHFSESFLVSPVLQNTELPPVMKATDYGKVTRYIAHAIENDGRNPHQTDQVFLNVLDKITTTRSNLLINGSIYSEFSIYLFRYLSAVAARGENILVICSNDLQAEEMYHFFRKGFSVITSLYSKDGQKNGEEFDHPIWRILKITESDRDETLISDCTVLVTTMPYVCSTSFEKYSGYFINLLDTVILSDTLSMTLHYRDQLNDLNLKLNNIVNHQILRSINSALNRELDVRYKTKSIRYLCFDDSKIPGLDKVVRNLMSVEFDSADFMKYNESCLISCYNYAPLQQDGISHSYQFIDTTERIGLILNLAVLACAYRAERINIFSDDGFPYNNIIESLQSNMGQLPQISGADIALNSYRFIHNDYSVVIVFDESNNLPQTIRRYNALLGSHEVLLMIVSRPYLFRDYYISQLDARWKGTQLEQIPVLDTPDHDIAHRILVLANNAGVTEKELLEQARKAPLFREHALKGDVNAVLRAILNFYNIPQHEAVALYRYFEYTHTKELNEKGEYTSQNRIHLRKSSQLYEIIGRIRNAVLVTDDNEYQLSVPVSMMFQKYLPQQNMIYNGNIYHIRRIDLQHGRLYGELAFVGKNDEPYDYIQSREYRLEYTPSAVGKTQPTKHVIVHGENDGICVEDMYLSFLTVPMEVMTKGYYAIDPDVMLKDKAHCTYYCISDEGNDDDSRQAYRRYGSMTQPSFTADDLMSDTMLNASETPARVVSIRMKGSFGDNPDRLACLAGVMLNEIIHSMFPTAADCIAVCPIFHDPEFASRAGQILDLYPRLSLTANSMTPADDELEFLIIEDCMEDTGVLTSLTNSGSNTVKVLFTPIFRYLTWYAESETKSRFLYFGGEEEPDCFDFEALTRLSAVIANENVRFETLVLNDLVKTDHCIFCGRKVVVGSTENTDDSRCICDLCQKSPFHAAPENLTGLAMNAAMYLESVYGVYGGMIPAVQTLPREELMEAANSSGFLPQRGGDLPYSACISDHGTIFVEANIPAFNTTELIIRCMTQLWQHKNLPGLDAELAEGHLALVSLQFYSFYRKEELRRLRTAYYESTQGISGIGYRRLVKSILQSSRSDNNPFAFLLSSDTQTSHITIAPLRRIAGEDECGSPYIPAKPDRFPDHLTYFYYDRLQASEKQIYTTLLSAIFAHRPSVEIENAAERASTICAISQLLQYERADLFYFRNVSIRGNTVTIHYGATAEEAASLNRRLEAVAQRFLDGITPEMSAYDVLLRLHIRMINYVDYDSIALHAENKQGGPAKDKIDSLRTICGALLDGKAVCEGYARAMMYLVQKCGIECAEVGGVVVHENGKEGEGHAWNIVKLDGDYYYLDTTWCDQSNTIQTVKKTSYGFAYFCNTTQEMLRSRKFDELIVPLPECHATRCNYYYHNGLLLHTYDLSHIGQIARYAAANHRRSFTFKCASEELFSKILTIMSSADNDFFPTVYYAVKDFPHIVPGGCTYDYDNRIYTINVFFRYQP